MLRDIIEFYGFVGSPALGETARDVAKDLPTHPSGRSVGRLLHGPNAERKPSASLSPMPNRLTNSLRISLGGILRDLFRVDHLCQVGQVDAHAIELV